LIICLGGFGRAVAGARLVAESVEQTVVFPTLDPSAKVLLLMLELESEEMMLSGIL
jgi:hypothetical protein